MCRKDLSFNLSLCCNSDWGGLRIAHYFGSLQPLALWQGNLAANKLAATCHMDQLHKSSPRRKETKPTQQKFSIKRQTDSWRETEQKVSKPLVPGPEHFWLVHSKYPLCLTKNEVLFVCLFVELWRKAEMLFRLNYFAWLLRFSLFCFFFNNSKINQK